MLVQFGYVTLFVMCFPLIPLLAIINNIFELKVDAITLVKSSQRPDPNGSSGLGTWNSVLQIFSILSVATNTMFITMRTNLLSHFTDDIGDSMRLYLFFGFCIFLGAAVLMEKLLIPDVPDYVVKAVARQRLLENRLIFGRRFKECVDAISAKEHAMEHANDWSFDPHLPDIDLAKQTQSVPLMISNADPEGPNGDKTFIHQLDAMLSQSD